MSEGKEIVTVQVNLDITVEALKAVVANAKAVAGTDAGGVYRVDTADKLGEIISRFLEGHDFEGFAKDLENYN
ncbi:MAG: hypothetical protein JEZ12_03110 [Desulfobacterium sp.]|nr:hypothetical protein [Desulfobacterium sp.]